MVSGVSSILPSSRPLESAQGAPRGAIQGASFAEVLSDPLGVFTASEARMVTDFLEALASDRGLYIKVLLTPPSPTPLATVASATAAAQGANDQAALAPFLPQAAALGSPAALGTSAATELLKALTLLPTPSLSDIVYSPQARNTPAPTAQATNTPTTTLAPFRPSGPPSDTPIVTPALEEAIPQLLVKVEPNLLANILNEIPPQILAHLSVEEIVTIVTTRLTTIPAAALAPLPSLPLTPPSAPLPQTLPLFQDPLVQSPVVAGPLEGATPPAPSLPLPPAPGAIAVLGPTAPTPALPALPTPLAAHTSQPPAPLLAAPSSAPLLYHPSHPERPEDVPGAFVVLRPQEGRGSVHIIPREASIPAWDSGGRQYVLTAMEPGLARADYATALLAGLSAFSSLGIRPPRSRKNPITELVFSRARQQGVLPRMARALKRLSLVRVLGVPLWIYALVIFLFLYHGI